jgi:hypothetical protein
LLNAPSRRWDETAGHGGLLFWRMVVFVLAVSWLASAAVPGATFGNGIAGFDVCGGSKPPTVVLNHSLLSTETHAVMQHFWVTGANILVDRMYGRSSALCVCRASKNTIGRRGESAATCEAPLYGMVWYAPTHRWVEYYVDGEAAPSIAFQPAMACAPPPFLSKSLPSIRSSQPNAAQPLPQVDKTSPS